MLSPGGNVMRATTTVSARVGLKAVALLALGASVTLLGASCSYEYEMPPLDPYYHSCLHECVHYPRNFRGDLAQPVHAWLGKASEAPSCESVGLSASLAIEGIYGDLKETDRCPRCLCEARPCLPPAKINVEWKRDTEAPACEGTRSRYADMPAAWDGGCFAPPTAFAEAARRVVDVYSVDRRLEHTPCGAYRAPEDVDAMWGTFAVICDGQAYGHGCDDPEKGCVHPKPEGFRACVRLRELFNDLSASCPPEFPERLELYQNIDGCGICRCDEVKPRECDMTVSLYEDMDCTRHINTRPLRAPMPLTGEARECVDTPGEAGMKSLSVAVVKEERATCVPVGGERQSPSIPVGGEDAKVYCCEPAPGG
ncbi:hypothetical protein [Sorangium sp. So ce117]|uniref:hypothetical protein n=1 Tax=Sorangium sp. So ce117 TaxID=3133277 RepID=UPI003F5FA629